jgi:hypothetical protein
MQEAHQQQKESGEVFFYQEGKQYDKTRQLRQAGQAEQKFVHLPSSATIVHLPSSVPNAGS